MTDLLATRATATTTSADGSSTTRRRTGWGMTALAVAFLAFDGIAKVALVPAVVTGTVELGYPADIPRTLGVLLLACLVVYLVPRTTVLGAILLTGYLGGAVATHVRLGNPLLTHVLFPTYLGLLLWGGLYLRDARVRALIPVRRDR